MVIIIIIIILSENNVNDTRNREHVTTIQTFRHNTAHLRRLVDQQAN